MRPLRQHDIKSPVTLLARELELDARLLNSPVAQAQRVHCELIKQLERNAPWMIPLVAKSA